MISTLAITFFKIIKRISRLFVNSSYVIHVSIRNNNRVQFYIFISRKNRSQSCLSSNSPTVITVQ